MLISYGVNAVFESCSRTDLVTINRLNESLPKEIVLPQSQFEDLK